MNGICCCLQNLLSLPLAAYLHCSLLPVAQSSHTDTLLFSGATRSAELVCILHIAADDSISRLSLQGWCPVATIVTASRALKATATTCHCECSFKPTHLKLHAFAAAAAGSMNHLQNSFVAPLSWTSMWHTSALHGWTTIVQRLPNKSTCNCTHGRPAPIACWPYCHAAAAAAAGQQAVGLQGESLGPVHPLGGQSLLAERPLLHHPLQRTEHAVGPAIRQSHDEAGLPLDCVQYDDLLGWGRG